jgi:hypothetical protein
VRDEDKPTWGERFDVWTDKVLDRMFAEGREEKVDRVLDFRFRKDRDDEPAQGTSLAKANDLLQSSHSDRPIVRGGLGRTRSELSRHTRAQGKSGPATPKR